MSLLLKTSSYNIFISFNTFSEFSISYDIASSNSSLILLSDIDSSSLCYYYPKTKSYS